MDDFGVEEDVIDVMFNSFVAVVSVWCQIFKKVESLEKELFLLCASASDF